MSIIKCKICGGDLNIIEKTTIAECKYCGTRQTVPTVDDEKKAALFSRANRLLRACEFDKAAGEKKTLIPCYKDIDAYDMPKEFVRLQAQDMGKVSATQDLLRGVDKLIAGKVETKKVEETVPAGKYGN